MADDLLQHSCHPLTGEAGIHFQRQALPRISIHHAQHADRTSRSDHVMRKINRPFLIGRRVLTQWRSHPDTVFPLLPPQAQSRFPVDPVAALVVHSLTFSLQQHMQTTVSIPRLLLRQFHHLVPQCLVCFPGLVTIAADCQ
jgi:hypothetical protein